MNMKTLKNILTIYCLSIFIFLSSCNKDEEVERIYESSQYQDDFNTIPIDESISFFKSLNSKYNNISGKSKNNLDLKIELESIKQLDVSNTNAKLNVADVSTKFSNIKSQILQIEIDGKLQTVLFHHISNNSKKNLTGKEFITDFTGEVYSTNLQGKVLSGFSIENGNVISSFDIPSSSFSDHIGCWGIGCGIDLEEVIVTAPPSNPYIYPSNSHITNNYQWYRSQNNYSSMGVAYALYYMNKYHEDKKERISDKLTNTCAKSIFNDLYDGLHKSNPLKPEVQTFGSNGISLSFSDGIIELFHNSKILNYSIENKNISNQNAYTIGASTVISNSYLGSATKLSIARTMIHELTHAYLNARYSSPLSFDNGIDYRLKMEKYAKANGFPGIISNDFQHNYMGEYINAMAYSLQVWDKAYGTKTDLGWDYYYAMSFAGQFQVDVNGKIVNETDVFKTLIPDSNKRKDIVKKILNEQNGNRDAKSKKC